MLDFVFILSVCRDFTPTVECELRLAAEPILNLVIDISVVCRVDTPAVSSTVELIAVWGVILVAVCLIVTGCEPSPVVVCVVDLSVGCVFE